MKTKGSKVGSELERIVEAWLQTNGWKTHRAAATGFTKFQKKDGTQGFAVKSHDLFGVFDIIGFKRSDREGVYAETVAVQCTAPDNRSPRREKIIAAGPFPKTWDVLLISHRSRREGRRTDHWLVLEELLPEGWSLPADRVIDLPALDAHRKARHAAKKAVREPKA